MIKVRFLSNPFQTELLLIEGETVIDFCQRLMVARDIVRSRCCTCDYILYQNGQIINTLENRFSRLSEISYVTKSYYASLLNETLTVISRITGNMRRDNFEANLSCPICLEEITYVRNCKMIMSLKCCHRFHLKCLALYLKFEFARTKDYRNKTCPICRDMIIHRDVLQICMLSLQGIE